MPFGYLVIHLVVMLVPFAWVFTNPDRSVLIVAPFLIANNAVIECTLTGPRLQL